MKKRPDLGSQGGQLILEAVLIIVILFSVTLAVAKFFNGEELLKQIIGGPWQAVAGMMQNGVWATPDKGAASHPNGHFRHIVIQGEPAAQ